MDKRGWIAAAVLLVTMAALGGTLYMRRTETTPSWRSFSCRVIGKVRIETPPSARTPRRPSKKRTFPLTFCRARLREILKAGIRETVEDARDVEDELRSLLNE